MGFTYDTSALIAAERNDDRMWAIHRSALDAGHQPTVPAGVLAQAWRGGPQAQLSRLLIGCHIESFDEARARSAGVACARAGTTDVIDAAVVVGAAVRGDIVVTGDDDLHRLATALDLPLDIEPI